MNHPGTLHWHNGGDSARWVASELEAGAVIGVPAAGDSAVRGAARLREKSHDGWQRQTGLARGAAGKFRDEAQVLGEHARL